MKYPAIYKSVEGSEYLYQNKDSYYCYERQVWDSSEPHHDCHHSDTNITAEYLANTYGEVKGKEHADFIVKLAEVNNFRLCNPKKTDKKWFCFDDNELYFFDDVEDASDLDEKQITIPLPPECESVDEWPKVNDDVFYKGQKWTFVAKHSDMAMLFWTADEYCTAKISELQKPKTPERELNEELYELCLTHCDSKFQASEIARKLMDKYNITKKGEGDE